MAKAARLPIVDLSSTERLSTANLIRQACVEYGFFYLVNHGVDEELLGRVFEESRKFFSLSLDEKLELSRKEHRGYTPLYAEKLDPSSTSKGDSKESFYIGPLDSSKSNSNQWPTQGSVSFYHCCTSISICYMCHDLSFGWEISEFLPSWRDTMETYYDRVLSAGKRLISLIALALEVEEDYFSKVGALDKAEGFLRLLHYPGDLGCSGDEVCGASAHSDYGMITLLATDGVPGLQVCREKFKQPQSWEGVLPIKGAFIVNIGDMMERWTNGLFRSTLHRVMPAGQERYSMAFFLDPNPDCIVQCLESCCSESCPQRFPPIRSGDYMKERFRLTYGS
uniref:Fe2OG dioxygenase domain-containing protein n=3 Tax=Rhizophora mucronata TaxID=61149 RepID=A0A2P2KU46_RHIMU